MRARWILLGLLAISVPLGRVCGQTAPRSGKPSAASLQRELARRRRELVATEAEAERWLDVLVRYHLGLSVGLDEICGLSDTERARPRGELERQLNENLEAVSRASGELERRRADLRELRRAIEERPAGETVSPWKPAYQAPPTAVEQGPPAAPPGGGGHDSTAGGESAEPELAEQRAGSPPVLIRGAVDPVHRGIAFFMAGQHDKAKIELERAAAGDDAPLIAIFYLARVHEKLGEVARADSLFLQIEALSSEREGGEPWTSAARTARQHMNWMRDHGAWRLPAIPEGREK